MRCADRTTLRSALWFSSVQFFIPGNDATSRDAFGDSELPQSPEVEEALLGLFHHMFGVCGPCQVLCDVNTEEL